MQYTCVKLCVKTPVLGGLLVGKAKEISKRKLLGIAGLGWLFDAMDVGMLSFVIVSLQKRVGINKPGDRLDW